jgi:hypothetical protein
MGALRRIVVVVFTVCVGLLMWAGTPASAQTDVERVYVGVAPPVLGQVVATPAPVPPAATATPEAVLPFQVSSSPPLPTQARGGGLAFTGAELVALVAAGVAAVLTGAGLTRRARRHTAEQS